MRRSIVWLSDRGLAAEAGRRGGKDSWCYTKTPRNEAAVHHRAEAESDVNAFCNEILVAVRHSEINPFRAGRPVGRGRSGAFDAPFRTH